MSISVVRFRMLAYLYGSIFFLEFPIPFEELTVVLNKPMNFSYYCSSEHVFLFLVMEQRKWGKNYVGCFSARLRCIGLLNYCCHHA